MDIKSLCSKTMIGLLGLGLAACGGDDDNGAAPGSYADISAAVTQPTGTVNATTAPAIAEEYETIGATNPAGTRAPNAGLFQQRQTMACPSGGSYAITASGSQSSGQATLDYDNCCYQQGCCFSGLSTWYYANAGSVADFNYCGSYDLSYMCYEQTATLSFQGCFGSDGWVYVVEVNGDTFAVTGSYRAGNGTLEISGENGTFSCTYTNGSGSCTGDGAFSF